MYEMQLEEKNEEIDNYRQRIEDLKAKLAGVKDMLDKSEKEVQRITRKYELE